MDEQMKVGKKQWITETTTNERDDGREIINNDIRGKRINE